MEQLQNMKIDDSLLTLILSLVALVISVIALYYTIVTFMMKSGHRIRCDISTSSTVDCDDIYISNITLENLKDRATVIFDIYIRLGRGNYILIESFKDEPLILRPFEVYHKAYDPILLYSLNLKRISIDKLLSQRKLNHKILLSTTDGKYEVKTSTKKWRPEPLFFKNYTPAIVSPIRLLHNNKHYGKNVKFLVELKKHGNQDAIIPLRNDDYQLKIFNNFSLTKDCLTNKDKLERYLNHQKKKGNLSFDEIKIIAFHESVSQILREYDKELIELVDRNYFQYNILGRFFTIMENKKMRKRNKELNNKGN